MPITNNFVDTISNYRQHSIVTFEWGDFISSNTQVFPAKVRRVTTYRDWSRTTNFAQKKRAGSLLPLAYRFERTTLNHHVGYFRQKYYSSPRFTTTNITGVMTDITNSFPTIDPPSARQIANVADELITDIRNKMKDSKVNLAQFVGEREQALGMLSTAAVRFAQAYHALRRGDLKGAANAAGATYSRKKGKVYRRNWKTDKATAASDAWLEFQYGWKPLLQDIYGAVDLYGQLGKDAMTCTVTNKKSVTVHTEKTLTGSQNYKRIWTGTHKYTVKVSITYGHPSVNLNANLASQLGLTNPALLAWELAPFSFVVDWFLPIGSSLSSLDATIGLTFRYGTLTYIDDINGQEVVSQTYVSGFGADRELLRHSVSSFQTLNIRRTVLPGFPGPTLPTFKNPISMIHTLNSIALLQGVFRR